MRLLNLCSGTGSVSGPFRESGWEVVEVDWGPTFGPTHCCNLLTWECPYEAGFFDCVWCSPDCRQYSRARTKAKNPRDLDGGRCTGQEMFGIDRAVGARSLVYGEPRQRFVEDTCNRERFAVRSC